jgi:hypothetical protein
MIYGESLVRVLVSDGDFQLRGCHGSFQSTFGTVERLRMKKNIVTARFVEVPAVSVVKIEMILKKEMF